MLRHRGTVRRVSRRDGCRVRAGSREALIMQIRASSSGLPAGSGKSPLHAVDWGRQGPEAIWRGRLAPAVILACVRVLWWRAPYCSTTFAGMRRRRGCGHQGCPSWQLTAWAGQGASAIAGCRTYQMARTASTHARTRSTSRSAQIIQLGRARLERGRRPPAMQIGGSRASSLTGVSHRM